MNMSLFRNIRLGGDKRLELRVETFNLFNWVNYGFPAANVGNAGTFGRITSTLGDPREMQLAVKFTSREQGAGSRERGCDSLAISLSNCPTVATVQP